MRRLLLAATVILVASSATAQQNAPAFDLPIDCKFGENCDLMLFVDHDGSKGWQDYRCGNLSYDNHKGTDIRLRSIDLMLRGVDVLAAADGRVVQVRRGMADVSHKAVGRDVITRRGLGNVVILDHGRGWRTIYAHLKRHSIRVAKGQQIKAGQTLGQVGMSGLAQNPHLHFGVLHRNRVVDPFTGGTTANKCGTSGKSLWAPRARTKLRYPNALILGAGFSDSAKFNRVALVYGLDLKGEMYRKAPNFIFAVDFGGVRKGDDYELSILSPDGKTLAESKRKISQVTQFKFDFVGRKGHGRTWPKGTYKGRFALYRNVSGVRLKILETERTIQVR